mgnify:CR=1 FL=1
MFFVEYPRWCTKTFLQYCIGPDVEEIQIHTNFTFSTECIKQLKEMFPDVEEEKLLETLRSNNYSSEDAISELLGLSEMPGCGNEGQMFKYM